MVTETVKQVVCPTCGVLKDLTNDNFIKWFVDGKPHAKFYEECRDCRYWVGVATLESVESKYCKQGKHTVAIQNFKIKPHYADGLYPYCNDCTRQYARNRPAIAMEQPPEFTPFVAHEPEPIKLTFRDRIKMAFANHNKEVY